MICETLLNLHRLVSIRVLAVTRNPTTSAIHNSGEQTLDSVSSLVHQTRLSVVSDDCELCQQVVRIYRRLGERREQMHQLRTTIAHTEQSGHDSSTVEIFLGFVSRFSVNGPNSSIDYSEPSLDIPTPSWNCHRLSIQNNMTRLSLTG